jgi:hypothetical protein
LFGYPALDVFPKYQEMLTCEQKKQLVTCRICNLFYRAELATNRAALLCTIDHVLNYYAHMSNYGAGNCTLGDIMPEPTSHKTNNDESTSPVQRGCIDDTTCACGEKHEPDTDGISHREACTSPLKFGGSCCCQPDEAAEPAHHRCGHGPRCQ